MHRSRIALPTSAMAPTIAVALALAALPTSAFAMDGLYAGLSFGYGSFTGSRLIITDNGHDQPVNEAGVCCPKGGIATEFRLGYAIAGIVAPEFAFSAHGWDLGSKAGGTGFIGGGLRLYPVGLIDKLGLDAKDFPLDISIAGNMGYNLVGKDFAYTGFFFGLDLTAEYIVAEVFSTGIRAGWALPSYAPFAYTDYNNGLGRCLDSTGSQDPTVTPFKKGTQSCSGSGPSTSYLTVQLTATFHFQLFN
ncbi:MAG: hypothetical protein U1E65_05270 [Myxococcota bacterium]